MDYEGLIREYLAKADEAAAFAAACKDRGLKDSWIGIALSYRAMAQRHIDGQLSAAVSEQPAQTAASKADPE